MCLDLIVAFLKCLKSVFLYKYLFKCPIDKLPYALKSIYRLVQALAFAFSKKKTIYNRVLSLTLQ